MKIALAYLEYSHRGGIERASSKLALGLARLGHEVHFYCADRMPGTEAASVHFHHVHTLDLFNSARLFSFALIGKMRLGRERYDVIHSFGNVIGSDVITAQSCHRAGLRIAHADEIKRIKSGRNFGIADRIRLFIEHENYANLRCRKIIAVSEGVKQELMQFYGVPQESIRVIPNGVDMDQFNPARCAEYRRSIRTRLHLSADDFVVLFVGNEKEGCRVLPDEHVEVVRPEIDESFLQLPL